MTLDKDLPAEINQTAVRIMTILEVLRRAAPTTMGVTEIAQRAELWKSTTSRILSTLAHCRVVERDGDGRYRLGIALLELGMSVFNNLDLRVRAVPDLRALAEASSQTVHLGVPNGDQVIFVEKLESSSALQTRSRVGFGMPLASSGLGKAMLAFFPPGEIERVLANPLERRTDRTITDPGALRLELDEVRRRGYALDDEENQEGVRCLGAPVFDHVDTVVAGISITGAAFYLTDDRLAALAPLVVETAAGISRGLGWLSPERHLAVADPHARGESKEALVGQR